MITNDEVNKIFERYVIPNGVVFECYSCGCNGQVILTRCGESGSDQAILINANTCNRIFDPMPINDLLKYMIEREDYIFKYIGIAERLEAKFI